MPEIGLVTYPPIQFMCVSQWAKQADLPQIIPAQIGVVMGACGDNRDGAPRVYYVGWESSEGGEIWVGFPVKAHLEATGEATCRDIPGGTAYWAVHEGDYSQLAVVWQGLMQGMQSNGYKSAGLSWEDYFDPGITDGVAKTGVYIAIEPPV